MELDNFDQQNITQKAVRLYASPDAPKDLKLKFAECVDLECNLPAPFQPVVDWQFIPACRNLTEQFCVVKIKVI